MKQFRLEKSTTPSHSATTRFNVFDARGDVIGCINVDPSEEADLLAHWKSAPQPRATAGAPVPAAPAPAPAAKPTSAASALVAAFKRNGAPRAATTGKKDPMIGALVSAAKKQGPVSQEAILRGC